LQQRQWVLVQYQLSEMPFVYVRLNLI